MLKQYKLVIFDVDGTLLDTTEGILEAVSYVINLKKLRTLRTDEMLEFIGPPIQESFKRFYGIEGEELQDMADQFRTYYKDKSLFLARPYNGVFQVLDKLRDEGIEIAVATYKRQDYARKLLEYFGFQEYTQNIYGADNNNRLTKTDIIKRCMIKANACNLQEVLMVGDSEHDKKGAVNIGIDFVGVTYGFGFKDEKEVLGCKVVGVCNDISDLLKFTV